MFNAATQKKQMKKKNNNIATTINCGYLQIYLSEPHMKSLRREERVRPSHLLSVGQYEINNDINNNNNGNN